MTHAVAAAAPVRAGLFTTDGPALLGGRCADCGHVHFPTRVVCPDCQSVRVVEAPLSTRGKIYTFTIVQAAPPGYLGTTPYAFGVVELPEGLRVTTTITAADLPGLAIGDAVTFELMTVGEGEDAVLSYAFRKEEETG